MAQVEVFVRKGLAPVDAGRARAVSVEEVAALAHETGDLEVWCDVNEPSSR